MPWCLMLLCCFLNTCRGEVTGISFVDSTPIEVCHPCRSRSHKVFKDIAGWGQNSLGWHFGFKLHLIINDRGELLAFKLTPGNTDDRKPVPEMAQDLFGKLFGDRGYISQGLFEKRNQATTTGRKHKVHATKCNLQLEPLLYRLFSVCFQYFYFILYYGLLISFTNIFSLCSFCKMIKINIKFSQIKNLPINDI